MWAFWERSVDKTPGLRGGCDLSVVLCRPTVYEHGQNRVKSYTGFFVNVYYEDRACPSQNFKVFLLTGGWNTSTLEIPVSLSWLNLFYVFFSEYILCLDLNLNLSGGGGSLGNSVLQTQSFDVLSCMKAYLSFFYFLLLFFSKDFLGNCFLNILSRPAWLLIGSFCLYPEDQWVIWG